MAQKRARPGDSSVTENSQFAKSNTIHDRASSFIAIYSPVLPRQQLQSLPEFRPADHRIVAWRTPSKQTTLTGGTRYNTGHDDDGEQWSGKRLEKVLEMENVTGTVVVARWYGGVLLGPVRFKWIEDCAKEAIARYKRGQRGDVPASSDVIQAAAKRVRTDTPIRGEHPRTLRQEEPGRSKESIVEELKLRDNNITALRGLLHEKKAKLEGITSPSQPSPAKAANYDMMPIDRLQTLERARDATVAHILKQLDKADQQIAEEAELDAAFEAVARAEEQKMDDEAFADMEEIFREQEREKEVAETEKPPSDETGVPI